MDRVPTLGRRLDNPPHWGENTLLVSRACWDVSVWRDNEVNRIGFLDGTEESLAVAYNGALISDDFYFADIRLNRESRQANPPTDIAPLSVGIATPIDLWSRDFEEKFRRLKPKDFFLDVFYDDVERIGAKFLDFVESPLGQRSPSFSYSAKIHFGS